MAWTIIMTLSFRSNYIANCMFMLGFSYRKFDLSFQPAVFVIHRVFSSYSLSIQFSIDNRLVKLGLLFMLYRINRQLCCSHIITTSYLWSRFNLPSLIWTKRKSFNIQNWTLIDSAASNLNLWNVWICYFVWCLNISVLSLLLYLIFIPLSFLLDL